MSLGPLQKLFDLIAVLRGENGCPWDRAQKVEDILSDLVEECYEVQWAFATGGEESVLDETGDVLFVLVFAIVLLNERYPRITVDSLVSHAYEKIHRRHPHVFGDAVARTRAEGLAHWESMKAKEKSRDRSGHGPFEDIPGSLPPLRRAEQIQKRAARAGFDWANALDVLHKIREEIGEIEQVVQRGPSAALEEELGDLLFSVVNLTRFLHIDANKVLTSANAKFMRRYETMLRLSAEEGVRFEDLDIDTMESYWRRAKQTDLP